ncbi:hypothetical protein RCL1_008546 [Eukaryota sp. TZLM3-RCL]
MHRVLYLYFIVVLLWILIGVVYPVYKYHIPSPSFHLSPLSFNSTASPHCIYEPAVLLHITDIHLSQISSEPSISFAYFLERLHIFSPNKVIATGDLVDSMTGKKYQSEAEWKEYKALLSKFNVFHPDIWVDMQGNHDLWGGEEDEWKTNLYQNYSVAGYFHSGIDRYIYATDVDLGRNFVRIIATSMTEFPGFTYVLNYFTFLNKSRFQSILKAINQPAESGQIPDLRILCSHWPKSHILTSFNQKFSQILSSVDLFLSGHTHRSSLVYHDVSTRHTSLYTRSKVLEITTPDLAHGNIVKVLVVDGSILAEKSVVLGHDMFPVVMFLNLPTKFMIPFIEKIDFCQVLTVRIMIFDPCLLENDCPIIIDGKIDDMTLPPIKKLGQNLFSFEFSLLDLMEGDHVIFLTVMTSSGSKSISQSFSFSNSAKVELNYSTIISLLNLPLLNASFFVITSIFFAITLSFLTVRSIKSLSTVKIGQKTRLRRLKSNLIGSKDSVSFISVIPFSSKQYNFSLKKLIPWYFIYFLVGIFGLNTLLWNTAGRKFGPILAYGTIINWKFLPNAFNYSISCLNILSLFSLFVLFYYVDQLKSVAEFPHLKQEVKIFPSFLIGLIGFGALFGLWYMYFKYWKFSLLMLFCSWFPYVSLIFGLKFSQWYTLGFSRRKEEFFSVLS